MRFYELTVSSPATSSEPARVVKQWSSHPNGKYNPNAQNIEFDMPVTAFATPSGGQMITIEGISLDDLQRSKQFTGLNLSLKAGMSEGLPLNHPEQSGVIAIGYIFQSFGNWVGTEMSLHFVVYPNEFYIDSPGNIVLNWKNGTTLASALASTFKTAFPLVKANINISSSFKIFHDEVGYYPSLEALGAAIYELTAGTGNPVNIVFQKGQIFVYDNTNKPEPKQINFTDLVGQPSWINVNIMQVITVMRADIAVGSRIKMPQGFQNIPGLITTKAQSLPSSMKYKSTFSGDFYVIDMRHLGNYRTHDGQSWVTIMNCAVSNG